MRVHLRDGCRLLMRAASAAEVCGLAVAAALLAASAAAADDCRDAEPGGVEAGEVRLEAVGSAGSFGVLAAGARFASLELDTTVGFEIQMGCFAGIQRQES